MAPGFYAAGKQLKRANVQAEQAREKQEYREQLLQDALEAQKAWI